MTSAASRVWAPVVAGVVVAAALFELLCPTLRPQSLSLTGLMILAMSMLAIAMLVSGLAAKLVWRVIGRGLSVKSGAIVAAGCVGAVWVPAWVLCMRRPSILTVFAACFCVATLSSWIRRNEVEVATSTDETFDRTKRTPFWTDDSKPLVRVILPSLILALLAEAAAAAGIAKNFLLASILAGGCIAVLVWRFGSKASPDEVEQMSVPDSGARLRVGLTALAFTAIVLLPYVKSARLSGGLDSLLKSGSGMGRRGDTAREQATSSGGYSGIILLPLAEQHKKIVAPERKEATTTGGRVAQPLVIPFDGAYWYFKAPDKRPRPTARVVRGSSTKAVIRSSDRYPLLMEAHQKLEAPIDLRCCSMVEIAVVNADQHPGPIALELWLLNKRLPGGGGLYLGTVDIPSSRSDRSVRGSLPAEETLEFPVPAGLSEWRFEEISVVVRTSPVRAREGAQIAIRRFVLRP